MSELWDRYYELNFQSGLQITADDLDVEFTVENDTASKAGQAEITIYNLSDSSKQKIKKGDVVQLKAGYRDDYGTIFYGTIDKIWVEKDGADVKTVIQASDSMKQLWQSGYVVRKYSKGTPVANIVRDMFSVAGVPVGKIEDPGITLQKDMVFRGSPKRIVETCLNIINGNIAKSWGNIPPDVALQRLNQDGWTAYVKNNMGYLVRGDFKDREAIVLSSETGLIEVTPEESEDADVDYHVRCLLCWKASQGSIIKLESIKVSGVFAVREYKHVCRGEDYYSELGVKAI